MYSFEGEDGRRVLVRALKSVRGKARDPFRSTPISSCRVKLSVATPISSHGAPRTLAAAGRSEAH